MNIVTKLGGSSLASGPVIKKSLQNILKSKFTHNNNHVVVASAFYGITDMLIKLQNEYASSKSDGSKKWQNTLGLIDNHHKQVLEDLMKGHANRDKAMEKYKFLFNDVLMKGLKGKLVDQVVTAGEVLSSAILAEYMGTMSLKKEIKNATRLINTNENKAVNYVESCKNVKSAIAFSHDNIPVMPGFVSADVNGKITNMGRGGTDLTAAIVSASIPNTQQLEVCKLEVAKNGYGLLKEVLPTEMQQMWLGLKPIPPNILNCDTLSEVSYNEALEMSHFGRKVLHQETMIPLMKANIKTSIKNTFLYDAAETLITNNMHDERPKFVAWLDRSKYETLNENRVVDGFGDEAFNTVIGIIGNNVMQNSYVLDYMKELETTGDIYIPTVLCQSNDFLAFYCEEKNAKWMAIHMYDKFVNNSFYPGMIPAQQHAGASRATLK